jgi:glycosyltransferase involved in cell wall biosynthesis
LPETLRRIGQAVSVADCSSEIIVVDNSSEDETRHIAESFGARVCQEDEHNIARVRNTGARNAVGNILVFVDADTHVPPSLFQAIVTEMTNGECFGGAVAVAYGNFQRRWMKAYLLGWTFWEAVFRMRQGAAQFCRREVFSELGGYDESIHMGEDVEFHWRLANFAKAAHGSVCFIKRPTVTTSTRRFDKMSWWKAILLTNPLFIALTWKNRRVWVDWYTDPVR